MFRPPNEKTRSNGRRLVQRTAAVLVVLALLGVVVEIGVRIAAPQDLISDVMQLGGAVCHQLEPGVRGVQRSPEYAVDIRINEQGLRDHYHGYDKRDDVYRILLLGDSHAFGWGVAMDEAFPQVLERRLNENRTGPTTYEVVNAGTIGFGTGHQYQYLTSHGMRFAPDMVVMAIDFVHDVIANNNRYSLLDGTPMRNARTCVFETSRSVTSFVPFGGTLRGHSHAFRFFGTHAVGLLRRMAGEPAHATAPAGDDRMDLTVTRGIIDATAEFLEQRGIRFAVVILPEFREYDRERLRTFESLLREREIAYVSVGTAVGEEFFPSELTFQVSPHFSAAGHRILAEQIQEFLETGLTAWPPPGARSARATERE